MGVAANKPIMVKSVSLSDWAMLFNLMCFRAVSCICSLSPASHLPSYFEHYDVSNLHEARQANRRTR